MPTTLEIDHPTVRALPTFSRVVCGVDGSPEAGEGVREAALLAPDRAHLFLTEAVVHSMVGSVATMMPGGTTAPHDVAFAAARADLGRSRSAIPDRLEVVTHVSVGPPAPVLMSEAHRVLADTIVVGSHGHGRAAGVLLGSTATRLIRHAHCSVLIARSVVESFPRSIIVGVDMSEPSLSALRIGRELAGRLGVPLRALHVSDGTYPADRVPAGFDEDVEEVSGSYVPADGLAACATAADLLIIGSRGLRGLHALGSVSESVAHRAPSSVLVVRPV